MVKKIFTNTLITVALVVALLIALFLNVLNNTYTDRLTASLKEDVTFIERGLKDSGLDYLEGLNSKERITIVSSEGEVIFDNRRDSSALEDHSDREEIGEALENGEGYARRYSDSLGVVSIYYAKALSNGNVIRVSLEADTVTSLLVRMVSHLFWIVVIALLIAMFLAQRAAKKIVEPINKLDVNKPIALAPYKELTPLIFKINEQNYTIEKQIEKLEKRKEELKNITANMNEGLLVINAKEQVLSANDAALKLFGIKNPNPKDSVYEYDHSRAFMEAVKKALKGEASSFEENVDHRYLEFMVAPVNVDDVISGATIVVMDITEKRSQEMMRREFSSNVSHELKTPLTSISGFAELLKNNLVAEKDVSEIGANIYDEAQRLISMIQDIIKISRLDEASSMGEKEEIELNPLVLKVFSQHADKAKEKNIALKVEGEAKFASIRHLIDEIISNLVSNAIKYNKENGEVDVTLKDLGKEIEIVVKDNGIGIAPEDEARIFERFYRADKAHSGQIPGTGLGLSIVKHAVSYLGGAITLDSKLDKGTTFRVVLPK